MNGTTKTPVDTDILAEQIEHHWGKDTIVWCKYSTLKSFVFASSKKAEIANTVNNCAAHAQAAGDPWDIDQVIHHQFACEDGISLVVKFRRSDVLDNLEARQDAAAALPSQSSRKRQSSPALSTSHKEHRTASPCFDSQGHVKSCIVIQKDAETPTPASPVVAETPSHSTVDDIDLVAIIKIRWQEYLQARRLLDDAKNAAFQTASLKTQVTFFVEKLKATANEGVIHQNHLLSKIRNVANPPSDALDVLKLKFSGSGMLEYEAEIAQFNQPAPLPKAVATSTPSAPKVKKPLAKKDKKSKPRLEFTEYKRTFYYGFQKKKKKARPQISTS
ncbi:unnamed protein product [Clonostachys rosea]|uniref:Uncharacterized protein n=1 Tax=Bionectria ochroleuca TaxID=29856 RepID=A0ABY6UE55_BIOOC|nr:unnamed protein product [Clonostachys rosea]